MKKWEAICPAKINTFLSVGPPDARGYHPLRTIFQAVALFDRLVVAPADEEVISVAGADVPAENTLTKTLRLVRELIPIPNLSVRLEKGIPAQSGLGGGSSDAAGLLRILMRMMPDHFERRFAFEVAEAVGADVAFFLEGGRAKAEGYGQLLTPLPDPAPQAIVIAMPSESCSTVEAYRRLDQTPRDWAPFPDSQGEFGYNDFERVAPCGCLELIDLLASRGLKTMLTGSGSAVVALDPDPSSTAEWLAEKGYWAHPSRFLTRAESLTLTEHSWTS